MAITVKFLADIVDWVSGLGKTQSSVEDNEAALAELMEQATRLGLQIGKTTDEIARDFHDAFGTPLDQAQTAIERIAREGDDTERQLERNFGEIGAAARDAGGDIGTNMGDGLDRAKRGMDDLKGESVDTAREVAASFDGSAESIAGGFQEIAANAFAGFGPAGIAAGLAAAAGIGLLTTGFQQAEEERQKLEERANDLAQAYIEAGGQMLDALTVADRTAGILTNPEQRKEAEELAKLLGGDLPLAVRALAGDTAALAEVQTQAAAAQEQNNSLSVAATNNTGKRKTAIGEEVQANDALIAKSEELTKVQKDAALTAKVQSDILLGLIDSTQGATKEVDELGNELITLPDGKQILIKADTKQATTDISTFKGDVDAKTEPVTQKIKVVPDTSAWDNWRPPMKTGSVRVSPGFIYDYVKQPLGG